MATRQAISIDMTNIRQLADDVSRLDGDALVEAAVKTLNQSVDDAYELSRNRITVGINLSDDYLRRRLEVEHATPNKLEATITAPGDRSLMTRLASYNAQMVIVPRKTTRPSRGRGLLPIPAGVGAKQGGVRVEVRRGGPKILTDGFMLPLRAGAVLGDKFGVFTRTNGKLKHHYGPSVYQLFRYQIPRLSDEVADSMQERMLDEVVAQVEKTLK